MSLPQPPRLKHGELGAVLRAADRVDVSPERLASNAAGLKAKIAAGTAIALWKLLVPLVLLLAVAAGIVVQLTTRGEPAPGRPVVVAAPADAAIEIVAAPPDAEVAAVEPPPPPLPPPPPHRHVHGPAPAIDAGVSDAPAPPTSDLPEQLRLYEDARAAARAGDFATAIDRIDELLRRFPATPLRADAELSRADALARDGRLAEAASAFEVLAGDEEHRGRRGELLRTLGDLYRRLHDCTRAVGAYTRALAEHLSERDRVDAQRGRDGCTAP